MRKPYTHDHTTTLIWNKETRLIACFPFPIQHKFWTIWFYESSKIVYCWVIIIGFILSPVIVVLIGYRFTKLSLTNCLVFFDTPPSPFPDFWFYVVIIPSPTLETMGLYMVLMFPTPNLTLLYFSGIIACSVLASTIYADVIPSSALANIFLINGSSWKLCFN